MEVDFIQLFSKAARQNPECSFEDSLVQQNLKGKPHESDSVVWMILYIQDNSHTIIRKHPMKIADYNNHIAFI